MAFNLKQISRGFVGRNARLVYQTYVMLLIQNRFIAPGAAGTARLLQANMEYSKRASLHGMFKEIFFDQNYFIPATDAPLTIIDCGTNIGISLLYFKTQAPNAVIVGFEPNPHTFAIVSRNVAANNLGTTLHNVGLGARPEKVTFFTDVKDLASQSASTTKQLGTKKNYTLTELAVQLEPLSQYITGPIDILKLDIEGAEGVVIDELVAANKLHLVKKLFIEYHFDGVNTTYPLGKLLSQLEAAGFLYVINSGIELPYHISAKLNSIWYKIVAWRPEV